MVGAFGADGQFAQHGAGSVLEYGDLVGPGFDDGDLLAFPGLAEPILRWRKVMVPALKTRSTRGPVLRRAGRGSPGLTLGRAWYFSAGNSWLRL